MMQPALRGVLVAFLCILPLSGVASDKPSKASSPLSSDEVAIYREILNEQITTPLSVASETTPFDARSANGDCLGDIKLENVSAASNSFHELTEEVVSKANARLVDPKKQFKIARANDPDKTMKEGNSVEDAVRGAFVTGLFSMSEIAFDKEHRYAVVSYRFWCGRLCGNGATILFTKANGEWHGERYCTHWIS